MSVDIFLNSYLSTAFIAAMTLLCVIILAFTKLSMSASFDLAAIVSGSVSLALK